MTIIAGREAELIDLLVSWAVDFCPADAVDRYDEAGLVSHLRKVLPKYLQHSDKPEPHADAGKMVAVGEGRELPDKPGIWFRVGSDQAWLVQQDNDGSLCARAINVADLRESIGPHNDIHFQLSRGNWHPTTTTETERLRVAMCIYCGHGIPVDAADVKASHEILKAHDASCPANPLAKELTALREQLATAEREIPDSLVGWTITAAFADGSFRVQSPIGEVKRVTFFRNEAEAASAKGGA